MRTISSRLFAGILDILEQRGIPTAPLVEGLPYSEAIIREGRERLSWDVARQLLVRIEQIVGGEAGMATLGEDLLLAPSFSRVAALVSQVADPWQLYRVLRLWLAPALVPGIPRRYQETPEGEIIACIAMPAHLQSVNLYLAVMKGVFRHAPSLIGAPDSAVDMQIKGEDLLFRIRPAPVDPQRRILLQRDPTAQLASKAIKELIEQQIDIQSTWTALYTTIETLNERTRRLEAFGRLSQALAEKLEIDQLVRVILAVMLVDFHFRGGVLQLNLASGEAMRWGMGERDESADLTYPFAVAGQYRGRLELWGSPQYSIGGDNDSVAAIMPWLTLALTNAIAFQNLDDERIRSQDRLAELERTRDDLETREREYRLLVEDASDAIAVFSFTSGRVLEVNRALCEILEYKREELLTMRVSDLLEPLALAQKPFDRDAIAKGETIRNTRMALTRHGEVVAVECAAKLIDTDRIQLIARDVTQWIAAKEQLRESEERYALAVRGANDGLWDWNLRTGDIYFSPRWKSMLGFGDDDLDPSPDEWFGRIHEDDIEPVRRALRLHLDGDAEHFAVEHRIRHRNGSWIWVLSRGLAVRDDAGIAYRMAGSQTEVTERKAVEARLYHSAFHDSLTGLPNRAWCTQWLQAALDASPRRNFAVLYFDLDRFKVVNDSLGHAVGDFILVEIAQRLRRAVADTGHIARIGGDEFVVLIDHIEDNARAEDAVRTIVDAVRHPIVVENREIVLSCSIGVTSHDANLYTTPEELIRDADLAMYEAKTSGRARFAHYDQRLHAAAIAKMHMEVSLRKAIEQNELCVHYQPIVHGATGQILGCEALSRWPSPKSGHISPADFIPLAEESGLIHPLGSWIMRAASAQAMLWRNITPDLRISVNLSPQQFTRDDIVDEVRTVIETLGLPRNVLSLEITENALIEDSEAAIARIHDLRNAGAMVSIDDFGAGYSSLSYLVRLPVEAIKIDRAFVIGVEHDPTKRKIVVALLRLAMSLDLHVVAEGVETEAARALLVDVSPDVILQGNLFSRPVPADAFEQLLLASPLAP